MRRAAFLGAAVTAVAATQIVALADPKPIAVMLDGSTPPEWVVDFSRLMVDTHRRCAEGGSTIFPKFEDGFALVKWVHRDCVRLTWTIPYRYLPAIAGYRDQIERRAFVTFLPILEDGSEGEPTTWAFSTFKRTDSRYPHLVLDQDYREFTRKQIRQATTWHIPVRSA